MKAEAVVRSIALGAFLFASTELPGQNYVAGPLGYSVNTPRPINPAESTTNPSAQATQKQNSYLGSVPQKATVGVM